MACKLRDPIGRRTRTTAAAIATPVGKESPLPRGEARRRARTEVDRRTETEIGRGTDRGIDRGTDLGIDRAIDHGTGTEGRLSLSLDRCLKVA